MSARFLILGTGTGVGKTLVTTALAWQLARAGHRVRACKPVISGFKPEDAHTDSHLILQSLGEEPTMQAVAQISPWRYIAPLSPHMAAWKEGDAPTASAVADFCRGFEPHASHVLAEGAGGVMTPLNDRETFLDLAALLGWPVVLVAGSYLGSISHTLTALGMLAAGGVKLAGIVVSESDGESVDLSDVARSLQLFAPNGMPIYTLPRQAAAHAPWRHVPSLVGLCSSPASNRRSSA